MEIPDTYTVLHDDVEKEEDGGNTCRVDKARLPTGLIERGSENFNVIAIVSNGSAVVTPFNSKHREHTMKKRAISCNK